MAKSRFRQAKGYSDALKKRTEQSGGGGFITIFKDSMNLPLYKEPKDDDMGIDIIPYLATDKHPHASEGEHVYKLELWVHQMVGPEKGNYVCLRNFGEECPLCDARYEEMAEPSPREEVANSLKGSLRVIYNVIVMGEEDKGVQIWTASSFLAENNFKASAKNRKTGEKIPFSCPDEGRTIWFTCQGTKFNKEFAGISMEERDEDISDDILDQAFELEECIIIPDFDELEKIAKVVLGGGITEEGEEPDPPSRRRRGSSDDEPSKRGRKEEAEDPPKRTRRKEKEDDGSEEDPPERTRRKEKEEAEDKDPPKRTRRKEKSEDDEDPPKRTRRKSSEDTPEDKQDDEDPPKRTRRRRRE